MLYVDCNNGQEFTLHVGGYVIYQIDSVQCVQADGHELERACHILGRPVPDKRVFKFYGNDAVTIVNNWF